MDKSNSEATLNIADAIKWWDKKTITQQGELMTKHGIDERISVPQIKKKEICEIYRNEFKNIKRDEKILYWAKQLEHKSLSTSELVENVKFLLGKLNN
jgi:hypothetical protein